MFVIFTLVPLIVIIATLADIITRDDWQVKHLPKVLTTEEQLAAIDAEIELTRISAASVA